MSQFRHEVEQVRKGHAEERRADDFLPHPRGLVLAPTVSWPTRSTTC